MAYKYTILASGSPTSLNDIIELENTAIPEGGQAELKINFRTRFPGFDNLAQDTHVQLVNRGVRPWPEEWRLVFADPNEPVWYIRWQKGFPWAPVIVAVLIGLVILIASWAMYRVVKVVAEGIGLPSEVIAPIATIGFAGLLLFLFFTQIRGRP